MVNKKKRIFKLLFFPISLLLCLSIFLINSFAQSGFIVEDNGNLVSLNKFNGSLTEIRASNVSQSINYSTINFSNISGNDPYWYGSFDCFEAGKVYSLSIVSSEILQNWNFLGNNLNQNVSTTFTATQTTYEIGFEFAPNSYSNCFINIMLNEGPTALDYFPYGDYQRLDNAFKESNGFYDNINTIAFNGDYSIIDKETAYKYLSKSYMNFIDLLDYNNIVESSNRTGRQNLEIYFINPINISSFVYYLEFNGLPSESGNPTDYYISFGNVNGAAKIEYLTQIETKIDIPTNFMCSYIDIFWWNSDIYPCWIESLNSSEYYQGYRVGIEQGYTNGYNGGYTNGYNGGYNDGYDLGHESGYQNGYNDGINTDLQTNGLRTLFNSILSFPVDMIKSVFNFEFMGVNIASVIMFIVSIGIVAFVIKKFL